MGGAFWLCHPGCMKYLVILFFAALTAPACAADMPQPKAPVIVQPKAPAVEAPSIAIPAPAPTAVNAKPGKLTPAQQLRVTMRLPQVKKAIADLTVDEQRSVLKRAAPPRAKLTDAEREARAKAMRDSWAAKTPTMRTELRQKQLTAWQKLSPADRAYRKERMQEQLKALPEDDRKAIIAPFVVSNEAKAP